MNNTNEGNDPTELAELNKAAAIRAKTSARRARRKRELGENPVCPRCFYADPAGLIAAKRSSGKGLSSLLEDHHVVGQHNDLGLVLPLCRNCHAEVTELYRAHGIDMTEQPSFVELLIAALTMLAVFFRELADMFLRWVERIRRENLVSTPARVGQ